MPNKALVLIAAAVLEARDQPSTYSSRRPGRQVPTIHIHGGPFEIAATEGNPVPAAARLTKDTVLVGPGERYDVVWTAQNPGRWLLHCHINHHITNDGSKVDGGGGMTMIIDVAT